MIDKPIIVVFWFCRSLNMVKFDGLEWSSDKRSIIGVINMLYYVVLEILLGKDYNEKVDVWSCKVG